MTFIAYKYKYCLYNTIHQHNTNKQNSPSVRKCLSLPGTVSTVPTQIPVLGWTPPDYCYHTHPAISTIITYNDHKHTQKEVTIYLNKGKHLWFIYTRLLRN